MTPMERVLAAFSPEGAQAFPVVLCYESILIRDHWSELTQAPWWDLFSPEIERQLAWRNDVIKALGQDWFSLPPIPPREEREAWAIEIRSKDPLLVHRLTGEVHRLRRPAISGWEETGKSHSNHSLGPLPETPDDIDARFPVPKPFDPLLFRQSGQADLADALLREHPGLFPIASVPSPLWSVQGLLGFEHFMILLAENPDLVGRAADRALQAILETVQHHATLGARGIWIEECMTDMISPVLFQTLNLPRLQRLTDAIRTMGLVSIYYFCGPVSNRLDLLLSAGADALAFEEDKKGFCNDIVEIADTVRGRCVLLGNLDAMILLEKGSEAELRAELHRQAKAGRRNRSRFLFSLGSPVTPGTAVSRVRLFTDLAHEIGSCS